MSDPLAIAAVTEAIRHLLFVGVGGPGVNVIARPPDWVPAHPQNESRLNVFLYHTAPDAAWRNEDPPGVTPGEDARPALPLCLYYLVTAYGDGDDDVLGHELLGRAMSVLHDHPVLGAEEIRSAFAASDLSLQPERIRITPQPMTVEEMSRLWTTFQTQYRISAAYQARVVLISSRLPLTAPIPVLTRGDEGDAGALVVTGTVPPFPEVTEVLPATAPPGAGIELRGHDLEATVTVQLAHRLLEAPVEITPALVAADRIEFVLPAVPETVRAGQCGLSLLQATRPPSGAVSLAVAPRIVSATATRDAAGVVSIRVVCDPAVDPDQPAVLLLGEQAVARPRPVAPPGGPAPMPERTLTFTARNVTADEHLLRLRVDGVDSLLIDRTKTPPVFDPSQKVQVP